jgi:hypothetical protein
MRGSHRRARSDAVRELPGRSSDGVLRWRSMPPNHFPPPISSHDHERPLRGEVAPQVRQGAVPGDVEDDVVAVAAVGEIRSISLSSRTSGEPYLSWTIAFIVSGRACTHLSPASTPPRSRLDGEKSPAASRKSLEALEKEAARGVAAESLHRQRCARDSLAGQPYACSLSSQGAGATGPSSAQSSRWSETGRSQGRTSRRAA